MSTRAFKCLGIHLTNPMHKHKLSTEVLDHLSIWATGHWNVRNLITELNFLCLAVIVSRAACWNRGLSAIQMLRSSDAQVLKCSIINAQQMLSLQDAYMLRCSSLKCSSNAPMLWCLVTLMVSYSNALFFYKCSSSHRCSNAQMLRCFDARMLRCFDL